MKLNNNYNQLKWPLKRKHDVRKIKNVQYVYSTTRNEYLCKHIVMTIHNMADPKHISVC